MYIVTIRNFFKHLPDAFHCDNNVVTDDLDVAKKIADDCDGFFKRPIFIHTAEMQDHILVKKTMVKSYPATLGEDDEQE